MMWPDEGAPAPKLAPPVASSIAPFGAPPGATSPSPFGAPPGEASPFGAPPVAAAAAPFGAPPTQSSVLGAAPAVPTRMTLPGERPDVVYTPANAAAAAEQAEAPPPPVPSRMGRDHLLGSDVARAHGADMPDPGAPPASRGGRAADSAPTRRQLPKVTPQRASLRVPPRPPPITEGSSLLAGGENSEEETEETEEQRKARLARERKEELVRDAIKRTVMANEQWQKDKASSSGATPEKDSSLRKKASSMSLFRRK